MLGPNPEVPQPGETLHHRVEYYTWVDRHGNPVPPPNPSDYPPERVINLDIAPGQNLGLMIRGGCEYGLGIYVTGVDPGSVAERVGLQRGEMRSST
ncbi:Whirlin [Orchesella cincta]|uniref:Whirlin n=1 Tax=Orchesella cincta TaxID=48709 RepID=A0A1D2NHM9_ORCCI|nr:Whirlin [Orchesella cincta]